MLKPHPAREKRRANKRAPLSASRLQEQHMRSLRAFAGQMLPHIRDLQSCCRAPDAARTCPYIL
jgi:hypothetical protein